MLYTNIQCVCSCVCVRICVNKIESVCDNVLCMSFVCIGCRLPIKSRLGLDLDSLSLTLTLSLSLILSLIVFQI